MQMIHRLGTIFAIIDNDAETIFQTQFSRYLLADNHQMAEQGLIGVGCSRQLCDRLFWNNQKVDWCLSTDVVEGNTLFSKSKRTFDEIYLAASRGRTSHCDVHLFAVKRNIGNYNHIFTYLIVFVDEFAWNFFA